MLRKQQQDRLGDSITLNLGAVSATRTPCWSDSLAAREPSCARCQLYSGGTAASKAEQLPELCLQFIPDTVGWARNHSWKFSGALRFSGSTSISLEAHKGHGGGAAQERRQLLSEGSARGTEGKVMGGLVNIWAPHLFVCFVWAL